MISFDPAIQITRLPWASDILRQLAARLLESVNNSPDLSRVCILLNETRAQNDCRFHLQNTANQLGIPALIGPQIATLEQLAASIPLPNFEIVSDSSLQLILLDALKEHDYLYGKASPLALANDLLQLFSQITRHDLHIPEKLEDLYQRIHLAYTDDDIPASIESHFADRESQLIHHIWQALKRQLNDAEQIDASSAQATRLKLLATQRSDWRFFYVGLEPQQNLEIHCLNLLAANNSVEILTYNTKDSDFYLDKDSKLKHIDANDSFFDHLLLPETDDIAKRKRRCLDEFPSSPIQDKVFIYACHHLEQESQAIELQIRDWLEQGKKRIAFVCNDRKLARRVRARLERYHIPLNDKSGWSLSTSRSATLVELWLQCLETDFNYQAFLDLLKSPLLVKPGDEKSWMSAVYAFEKNIIYIEQISSGMNRYVIACKNIMQKLPESLHASYRYMIALLQQVQQAADLLRPCITSNHSPAHSIDALFASLNSLGCLEQLCQDHVGNILVDLLRQLKNNADIANISCTWIEFRTWLGFNLENARFNPPTQFSYVQLLTLEQSDIQEFDAVVIGGAQMEFMPGHKRASTFFNDTACRNLGLPDLRTQFTRSFHHFRRLLGFSERPTASAPVLICHRIFNNQEPVQMCAWVEVMQTSHRLIYQQDLSATYIDDWLHQLNPIPLGSHALRSNASAGIPGTLLPKTLSASAYQQLVNCPYQYYAARALRLQAAESIKVYMEKSDYGELVHRCLFAFHYGLKGVAKAFSEKITPANHQLANERLQQISDKVFAEAIGENFIHRAWRKKWERCINPYIEWLESQQENWQPWFGESSLSWETRYGVTLSATLDRVDTANDHLRILDYKTGGVAKNADVENGESVQLPFYALLAKKSESLARHPISELAFLKLDDGDVRLISPLPVEDIDDACDKHEQRLNALIQDIKNGNRLTAWGEESVCRFCDYQGLCRKEYI